MTTEAHTPHTHPMKTTTRLMCGIAMLACTMGMAAKNTPEMTRIYMFGFAASFTDSVAYQTDIQQIDSAWLDNHGLLLDRSLYSLQLQYYIEGQRQRKNATCTVFFNTNRRRLERTWNKVHKRYERAEGLQLNTLPPADFTFKAEEYRPIIIEEDTTATATATTIPPAKQQPKKQ